MKNQIPASYAFGIVPYIRWAIICNANNRIRHDIRGTDNNRKGKNNDRA